MRVCQFRHFGINVAPDSTRRCDGKYSSILKGLLNVSNPGQLPAPGASRDPSLQLRAKADHVAVGVFHLKFERPGMVGERCTNGHAARFQFVMEFLRVFYANPYPGAAAPLMAAAQVNAGAVAIDAGEVVAAPVGVP